MERLKDLRKDRTGLGVVCFLVTRAVLIFVDVSCVGAYFGIILCLLYFTFLKDCLEILFYALAKFSTRLKWLYRIFKIRDFLYTEAKEFNTDTNELQRNIPRNPDEFSSMQRSPCVSKNTLDLMALSGCNSISRYHSQHFTNSPSETPEVEGGNGSSLMLESPRSSRCGSQESVPRKLSYQSTQVVSSTDNFAINETTFEDVDLSSEKNDIDSNTSREDLNIKQSPSKWNISKMKILDTFSKNKLPPPASVKSQIGNVAAKVTEILPQADDKDKLIGDKNDSPEQVGCCSYWPQFLRSKYPISSIASYSRF